MNYQKRKPRNSKYQVSEKEKVFQKARLLLELTNTVVPQRGSVPMSFTRASVRRELDYSGLFVELLSGEVGFRGARRVRNGIAGSSEDLTNATWLAVSGFTKVNATQLDTAAGANILRNNTTFLTANRVFRVSLDAYIVSGATSGTLTIDIGNAYAASVTIDTAVKRYSVLFSVTALTNQWVDFEWTGGGVRLSLTRFQLEDVTGQSNQNPSEYVSVGAAKLNEWTNTGYLSNVTSFARIGIGAPVVQAALSPENERAWEVEEDGTTQPHGVRPTLAVTIGDTWRIGFLAKAVERTRASFWTFPLSPASGTANSVIDLSNGAVLQTGHATHATTVTDAGGGWYYIEFSAVCTSTGTLTIHIGVQDNSLNQNYTGTVGSGILLSAPRATKLTSYPVSYFPVGNVYPFHGAMVDGVKWFTRENPNIVVGNVVQEITGVAVPEIPYPQVLKGYTPMPAATNLLTYSGDLTNAAWTKAASVASIATYPPRLLKESLPSQLRDDSTAASIHGMFRNPTVTANTNYCAWIVVHSSGERFRGRIGFLDAATSSNGVICEFNARTGVTAAAAIGTGTLAGSGYINVAKGWGIVYVSGKIDAATTAAQVQFLLADSAGNLVYDGDGVSRMIVGHFQLETGTVPTNIIPTTSAAVTISTDSLTCPSAGLIGATGGSMSIEGSSQINDGATDRYLVNIDDGTVSERHGLIYRFTGAGGFASVDGGVAQANISTTNSVAADGHLKLAARFAANNFAVVMNSGDVATDTSGTMPTVSVIRFGSVVNGGYNKGPVSYFRAWDSLLTDAELKAITANGYADQKINTLGWVDSPQISHDGRRLYFMYSRYDFAPLLIDGASLTDLSAVGGERSWHVAIPHPSYDGDVYCAYLRHDGTVERIENLRFDPNYDDFSLQTASAESSIMEVAATASLPKRIYYNANRYGDVPKLVYRQENASGSWTTESTSELATVSSGGSGAGYIDDNAFVTDDRLALTFASTRTGGQGSSDLWLSTRAGPTDVWGAPSNLGTDINTTGHEDQIFLHPNGTDVWFTRDGGIYHCTRAGTVPNNDDTLVTFTGTPLVGGIGEPSTDEAMTRLYFSYLDLATRRIKIMYAPWDTSVTAWGTPVAID